MKQKKKVYFWEFDRYHISDQFATFNRDVYEEAKEVLSMGWDPSYIYGNNVHKNIFTMPFGPLEVSSFDFLNRTKFYFDMGSGLTYIIKGDFIYCQTYDEDQLHIWVETQENI